MDTENAPVIRRGSCSALILSMLSAFFLTILSAGYQSPGNAFCGGGLGGGWPLPFLCDASTGGSPLGSWGRIDFADVYLGGLSAVGFLADFVLFIILVWAAGRLGARIFHKETFTRGQPMTAAIGLAFVGGLICALLVSVPRFLMNDYSPRSIATPMIPAATAGPSAAEHETFQSLTGRHVSLAEGEWLVGSAAYFRALSHGCGTRGEAADLPYVVFLIQGPMEVDVEIEDGSWSRWVNLYDWNAAMAALGAKIDEVKRRPDFETAGYVECIIPQGG